MSPVEQLLTRGKVEAQAIGGGGGTFDLGSPLTSLPGSPNAIPCDGDTTLVVQVDMTAGAVGDLTVTVTPFEADNATLAVGMDLPPVQAPTTNPALSGGHDYFYGEYDVASVEYVRVRIANANVGAQTITRASWRLSS